MPATEQTWRDTKILHVVFGISAVVMLIATIWMLTADHQREWKQYQRQFREVETWTADARISEQDNETYRLELAKREAEYSATRQAVPPRALIDRFEQAVKQDAEQRDVETPSFEPVNEQYQALEAAPDEEKPAERDELLNELDTFVRGAKFRENFLLDAKKKRAAEFDVARSQYEIGVGNHVSQAELDRLQQAVDDVRAEVQQLTEQVEQASVHRKELESIVAEIRADELNAKKDLEDHRQTLGRLELAKQERAANVGKSLLEMPILDAFGRPLKVEQIWLPKLTINNNFRDVARFDRCITCHQAMDKTLPGSAVDPAFLPEEKVALELPTPAEEPPAAEDGTIDHPGALERVYGLQLRDEGLIDDDDVTVSVVRAESPAAKAGLRVGDVITQVNDVIIQSKPKAFTYLLESVKWGQPLKLTIRRGLPHPYVSHPRLDLFVGSLSPHKMGEMGCTICHEGQGSGTQFKWASHTPNSPAEADEWKREHGWFNNHHWIFPMNPKRFAESSCLKCHHNVAELEPSERFPDPPAPKLMAGYHLIREYGCFGCHEINGFDGPNRRIGPDMRVEPNYAAAAQALLLDENLSAQQREWASELVSHPENESARHRLLESIRSSFATNADDDAAAQPQLSATTRKLANLLDDVETPGDLRKVGPSLRHVANKADYDFLYSWIRRPKDFRPDTKMPQFFGLHDHLEGRGLEEAQRYEPVEIRGITEYLLAKSQPFEFADQPQVNGQMEEPSAERGKTLFQMRGCLACHKHADFPAAEMEQGPDLSQIGAKLNREGNEDGGKWLYSWLREPSRYHPRTLMPNLILDPIEVKDEKGEPTGSFTDPAADIAVYLLDSGNWKPENIPARKQLTDETREALNSLALEHLRTVFPKAQAEKYLETGIPTSKAGELKGDEVELLGEMSDAKKLLYVGRRAISKYGCAGCHDVPGFEDAKPIGTGLADWGRKTADKLAFEQIVPYLMQAHGGGGAHGEAHGDAEHAEAEHAESAPASDVHENEVAANGGHGAHDLNLLDMDPDTGFFMQKLMHHEREGFIWQKLREPRSYDYKKTENKGYNERLRMPKFDFNEEQIEAVMTFVLGLVAEPPAPQYVYHTDPRRQAIVDGQKIIEKYNCTGCHAFEMEEWKLAYEPGDFGEPQVKDDYSFLMPHATPQEIANSQKTDARGLLHATIVGMPVVNEETGLPERQDEDGAPIDPDDTETPGFYSFTLWENALINGNIWPTGLQNLLVPESRIEKRYPQRGGYLARLLYAPIVEAEKQGNPDAKKQAWGWLPPPLVGEGRKVQTAWLHDFLLDPHMIRPAAVLRMPKFNMSSEEATKLVNYFAAVDGVDYPYNFDPRTRQSYVEMAERAHPGHLNDALKIVTDNNFCIKCHSVGDYSPGGSDRAKGPALDDVYRRLRPEYTLHWIANPTRILPYTGMPVNVPPDTPVNQELYKGTSLEQLNALVDLLMNYDWYTKRQTSIKPLIKTEPAPAAAANQAAPAPNAGAAR